MISSILSTIFFVALCGLFMYCIREAVKATKELKSDFEDFMEKQIEKSLLNEENFISIQKNFNQIQEQLKKIEMTKREADKKFSSEVDMLKRSKSDTLKNIETSKSTFRVDISNLDKKTADALLRVGKRLKDLEKITKEIIRKQK